MNGLLTAYSGAVAGPWKFSVCAPRGEVLPERFVFVVGHGCSTPTEFDSVLDPATVAVSECVVTVTLTPEQIALFAPCSSYSYALYGLNASNQRVAVLGEGRGAIQMKGAV
jgi:hypothetical protein